MSASRQGLGTHDSKRRWPDGPLSLRPIAKAIVVSEATMRRTLRLSGTMFPKARTLDEASAPPA